jgi:RNA polymerase sigma-70 factor (ECF subfamily)
MVIRVPDQRSTPGGYSALDDRLLVLDFQAGNPQAFVEIHRRYGPLARRVCQRFLPNPLDSEEALQETMIRVFQGLYRFNGRYALQPWIARIAKNVSLDILRGHARRPQTDHSAPASDELPVPGDEADEIVERLVQRDTVLAVLADLPETHRRALMLRELEGRSHREVAQEMEITPSQAKALIHRAKGSFRRRWLEKVADRGGFMVVAFVPLLWLVRLGSFLRRIGERAGHAAQAAQVAVPEAMTSTVTASAAPSASTVGERLVAAGMTVLLAGGVTVGAAKIVTDRGDERADRAAVTAPTPAATKQRVKPPREDAPVRQEDPRFGDKAIKAEPPTVVEPTPSAVAEPTGPMPASAAVTCTMSPDQTLTVNVGAGGSITLSETAGTIVVNPDGGAADCVGNLVANVSTVEVNGGGGNESVSISGAFAGIGTVTVNAGDGDDTVNGETYGGVLVANGEAGSSAGSERTRSTRAPATTTTPSTAAPGPTP